MDETSPGIVRADPAVRRQALFVVLAVTLLGIVAIRYGLPWIEQWIADAAASGSGRSRRMVCLGAGAVIVSLAALVSVSGVNTVRIGRRVARDAVYPPPGLRLLRDTRVLKGRRAVLVGRVQAALGAMVLACAAGLLAIGGYVVVVLWP